jgi:hypothetical protein
MGARLAVAAPGKVAATAHPVSCGLSRYPTRSAQAVPGRVRSRARLPTAACGPSAGAARADLTAPELPVDPPERLWRR